MTDYRPGHLSPFRWLDFRRVPGAIRWRTHALKDRLARRVVNDLYQRQVVDTQLPVDGATVLADGMYDNANHFFRLKLFLDALDRQRPLRRFGVVRKARDRGALRSLRSLGFDGFLHLDETNHSVDSFRPEARRLLRDVKSHADLLRLDLPEGIPAYVFYDTVLKVLRHPQPPIHHEAWEYHLAELLRNITIYGDLFDKADIRALVFSHGWKNEYAPAVWIAMRRSVPAYHLTAYYESMRARLIVSLSDYACPKEKLSYEDYRALPSAVREDLANAGWANLDDRVTGATTDINGRNAYLPETRSANRQAARQALGISEKAHVGVVYAHAWHDFPHIFGLRNFTDFHDWMMATLGAISRNDDVLWLLKPHPLESWYGAFRLEEIARDLPDHVRVLPEKSDSLSVTRAADLAVTVHGTIGFEATAHGIPVIGADNSYYADWPIVHAARNREHYSTLLKDAVHLKPPSDEIRNAAAAFAYIAGASHPGELGLVRMPCDSLGIGLFSDIARQMRRNQEACARETTALGDWLASGSSSYSVYVKLKQLGHEQSGGPEAIAPVAV